MPIPEKKQDIKRPSIRDEVYGTLLNWIMEGVLKPGEKIVDKELAEHMGVSRTPVREALRRLEDKNLVESSANRWTRVCPIPVEEPEMIYPIIWTLEELALSSAAGKMTAADFARMASANAEFKSAIDAGDPVAAAKADDRFHAVFIQRSENDHLIRILEDLKIRYRRLEVAFFDGMGHDMDSVEEHEKLVSAIQKKDMDLAAEINRTNWDKSLEWMGKQIRRQND